MGASIAILDHGRPLSLDYPALLAYHGGGALAGAAIGFRAMQAAAAVLGAERTWDRKDLLVVSWHDGPGIRDAIEFVTRAITRGRFELRVGEGPHNCAALTAFRFELSDGTRTVALRLKDGVLPPRFLELAGTERRSAQQQGELDGLKSTVAAEVVARPLSKLFAPVVRELRGA
jgi:hypothetical protein